MSDEIDPTLVEVNGPHFYGWWSYWGELFRYIDHLPDGRDAASAVYGFENDTDMTRTRAVVPDQGACFGFVAQGAVTLWDHVNRGDGMVLREGRWFATPSGCDLHLHPGTRVVVSQRIGFRGMRAFGGPIEEAGRLRYIDRCSDSILMPPPVLGDPVLNHLHFPPGIEQTEHTHPSIRSGCVARGMGWCETPNGLTELRPGMVFVIPTDGRHRFLTAHRTMDVIAYHPDSDWGPTDDTHPMVNRTLVDGRKVDNTQGVHVTAEVVGR